MTPRDIEDFRRLLIDQLVEVHHEVQADLRTATTREVSELDTPRDEVDEAQRVQVRDLQERLAESDVLRAQLIEAALGRIDRGTFGECVDCGGEIELDRLRMLPWAARCLDCQEAVENESRARPPTM